MYLTSLYKIYVLTHAYTYTYGSPTFRVVSEIPRQEYLEMCPRNTPSQPRGQTRVAQDSHI